MQRPCQHNATLPTHQWRERQKEYDFFGCAHTGMTTAAAANACTAGGGYANNQCKITLVQKRNQPKEHEHEK